MAHRGVRNGSVLALLLVIMGALASLLVMELTWWNGARDDVSDSEVHLRLQNEAISAAGRVTEWLLDSRPGNPLDGSYAVVELTANDVPNRLDLTIPADVLAVSAEGVDVSARVRWCLYSFPTSLPQENADEWPPSLVDFSFARERAFAQMFAQSQPQTAVPVSAKRAGWHVLVQATYGSRERRDFRSVTVERVVTVSL
ncbi:MAG: hypothetical protein J6Z30_03325 [Pyramidobacter sp.]|nr:hypothetical protein [Pyramidobacter sp.]